LVEFAHAEGQTRWDGEISEEAILAHFRNWMSPLESGANIGSVLFVDRPNIYDAPYDESTGVSDNIAAYGRGGKLFADDIGAGG
jgi:hypothetical protein